MKEIKNVALILLVILALVVSLNFNGGAENYSCISEVDHMQLIIDSAVTEDYDNAEYYTSLRNQKIIVLELQKTYQTFMFDDLFCIAATIYQESGGGVSTSDEEMIAQGNVVFNRINDPDFPDTVRDVLEAPRQYANFHKHGVFFVNRGSSDLELKAIRRSYEIAYRVLCGERAWNGEEYIPDNVVYASTSKKGSGVWWYINGTYYCYK